MKCKLKRNSNRRPKKQNKPKKKGRHKVDTALAVDPEPTIEPGRERVYVLFVYQRPWADRK